jgi:nickel-dependent lactate racemase
LPIEYFHMGKGFIAVDIPGSLLTGVYEPPSREVHSTPDEIVSRSLERPIGCEPIASQISRGDKVLLVVDDITRETPAAAILPRISSQLEESGVPDRDVEVIFALGTHRYMTPEEMRSKAGPQTAGRYRMSNHEWMDGGGLSELGTTGSGVPITVNRKILESDWSIGIGNIVAHRIAGYTGGGKIVQPGLSGDQTTGYTHIMAGDLDGEEILGMAENPVRREMEEIARKAGLKMIANTVLDGRARMIGCYSGDLVDAHRRGVEASDQVFAIPIDHKADITLVDSHPADMNMWQAVKAIQAGELATKPGGTIVLLSPCWEGASMEHPELEKYGYRPPDEARSMLEAGELKDLVTVAAMIHVGRILEKFRVIVYTIGIPKKQTEILGFEYASSPKEALKMALEGAGTSPEILAFKRASEIVPRLRRG